jgi:hypothetical protein
MYLRALAISSAVAVILVACQPGTREIAPFPGQGGGSTTSGSGGDDLLLDAGPNGPPPADAGGLCGNQIHKVQTSPPNVYFVLDASGSMSSPAPSGTRYSFVQVQAAKIVKDLRYAINAGAAVFPLNATFDDACKVGGQVFPVTYNNPIGFDQATKYIQPGGGTPTSATLVALKPLLTALSGNTIVVLATDGGPNCNPSAACDITECQENIEGCVPNETCCAQQINCCAPGQTAGPTACIDRVASVQAVADLWAAGIKVAVIGIPGSKPYAKVLTEMALAGGAPQLSTPFYYAVDDLAQLGLVLQGIAGAAIPCDYTIADPPMDPNYTNVYLDKMIVPSSPTDGWTWTSPTTVTLHGAACSKVKSGTVAQVQIVSGCPTEVAK